MKYLKYEYLQKYVKDEPRDEYMKGNLVEVADDDTGCHVVDVIEKLVEDTGSFICNNGNKCKKMIVMVSRDGITWEDSGRRVPGDVIEYYSGTCNAYCWWISTKPPIDDSVLQEVAENSYVAVQTLPKLPYKLFDSSAYSAVSRIGCSTLPIQVTDMSNCVDGFTNLTDISGMEQWHAVVNNMTAAFRDTQSLTDYSPISAWNTISVANMYEAFRNAGMYDVNFMSRLRLSSVTTATNMFYNCLNLADISGLPAEIANKLVRSDGMFAYTRSLTSAETVASWEVEHLLTASGMFQLSGITGPAEFCGWHSEVLNNTSYMFENTGITSFTFFSWGDNTYSRNLCDASYMFHGCSSLVTANLSDANIKKASHMFDGCSSLSSLYIGGTTAGTKRLITDALEEAGLTSQLNVYNRFKKCGYDRTADCDVAVTGDFTDKSTSYLINYIYDSFTLSPYQGTGTKLDMMSPSTDESKILAITSNVTFRTVPGGSSCRVSDLTLYTGTDRNVNISFHFGVYTVCYRFGKDKKAYGPANIQPIDFYNCDVIGLNETNPVGEPLYDTNALKIGGGISLTDTDNPVPSGYVSYYDDSPLVVRAYNCSEDFNWYVTASVAYWNYYSQVHDNNYGQHRIRLSIIGGTMPTIRIANGESQKYYVTTDAGLTWTLEDF